jgi:excisionase family DNA binding protein
MTTNLMNVQEFAQALGVTTACIRRWILERKIDNVKVGRLVRIPTSELQNLINAGLRPAIRAVRHGK